MRRMATTVILGPPVERRLGLDFTALATSGIDHLLRWSRFRRTHQTRALISHYRRRGDPLPQAKDCENSRRCSVNR